MTQHDRSHQPTVTVIVPSYLGAKLLPTSLGSLARQTLAPREFEVVVVLNGPEDESRTAIDDVRTAFPELRLRIVEASTAGAGNARNLGLDAAAGRSVTFVDADDEVTPGYLKALLAHAGLGIVPVASVADVTDGGAAPTFDNYLSNRLLARAGEVTDPTQIPSSLGFVAGKIIPTAVARASRFDTTLRSGEDVVYWFDVFEAAPFRIRPVALDSDGVYLRHVVANSISRQARSYDFSVTQRLDVIERLWSRPAEEPRSRKLRASFISGQVSLVNAHLRVEPDDHTRVVEDIRSRGLEDAIPWRRLNAGIARDLGILYSFLPYADTSALVAARRIRDRGVVVDVVSNKMGADKPTDWSAGVIARENLEHRHHHRHPRTTPRQQPPYPPRPTNDHVKPPACRQTRDGTRLRIDSLATGGGLPRRRRSREMGARAIACALLGPEGPSDADPVCTPSHVDCRPPISVVVTRRVLDHRGLGVRRGRRHGVHPHVGAGLADRSCDRPHDRRAHTEPA